MNTALPKKPTARAIGRRPSGAPSGREAILTVAMPAFARYGYEAVSLRKLAAEADVDAALIARHFGSKSALWMAVVDRLTERQKDYEPQIRALIACSAQRPREALEDFISLFAQISFEMPALPSFLLQEATNPDERLILLNRRVVTPFRRLCLPIIEAAQKAGVIGGTDPALVFSMVITAISVPMVAPTLFLQSESLTATERERVTTAAIQLLVQKAS